MTYEEFKDKYDLTDEITGGIWSSGGTWGNCWDRSISSTNGDEPITDFPQLDKFLESHFSSIPFLTYKRLTRDHVKTNESHNGCWYGGTGSTSFQKYITSLDLYNFLQEENLLD